jgi:hypothetical protein
MKPHRKVPNYICRMTYHVLKSLEIPLFFMIMQHARVTQIHTYELLHQYDEAYVHTGRVCLGLHAT